MNIPDPSSGRDIIQLLPLAYTAAYMNLSSPSLKPTKGISLPSRKELEKGLFYSPLNYQPKDW